jgi:hypothetical protein
MASAARGQPNKILTLTVNITTGDGPGHRRDLLHQAWRNLVKRITRQFQLRPDQRWTLKGKTRSTNLADQVLAITTKTAAKEISSLPYLRSSREQKEASRISISSCGARTFRKTGSASK